MVGEQPSASAVMAHAPQQVGLAVGLAVGVAVGLAATAHVDLRLDIDTGRDERRHAPRMPIPSREAERRKTILRSGEGGAVNGVGRGRGRGLLSRYRLRDAGTRLLRRGQLTEYNSVLPR